MDQFPIPNRQRRRSNLGKLNRTTQAPNYQAPVFLVPAPRGLARSHSSKKKLQRNIVPNVPSEASLFAKKRLFQEPPLLNTQQELNWPSERHNHAYERPNNLYQEINNISLNETGVDLLVTTPNAKDGIIKSNSGDQELADKDRLIQNSLHSNKTNGQTTLNLPCKANKLQVNACYKNFEQPKLPTLSYNDRPFTPGLKPPVLTVSVSNNLHLQKSESEPPEELNENPSNIVLDSNVTFNIPKVVNHSLKESSENDKVELDCILEELDTTASFNLVESMMAEETLIESPRFVEPLSVAKSTQKKRFKDLEPVAEEDIGSDSEDEILQEALLKLNSMTLELENMKKLINSLIRRKNKRKSKIENKENISCVRTNELWMSEVKSENPFLLKTPKLSKNKNISLALQSTWTPRSLTAVLSDQVDDLLM